jgi:hypothetical protein
MSNLRAAAQQALKTIESWNPSLRTDDDEAAITALRAALAQPEQEQEPVAWLTEDGDRVVTQKTKSQMLRDGGAASSSMTPYCVPAFTTPPRREWQGLTEQEPAARVLQTVGQYHNGRFVAEVETARRLRDGESLYTHPPRREWQGLTEEKIEVLNELRLTRQQFARAVKAALKEKNNG